MTHSNGRRVTYGNERRAMAARRVPDDESISGTTVKY